MTQIGALGEAESLNELARLLGSGNVDGGGSHERKEMKALAALPEPVEMIRLHDNRNIWKQKF